MQKLLVLLVLAAGVGLGQVSVGIRIGAPPPPRVFSVPRSPGPGFIWVGGYWYPDGHRYKWHSGYWSQPPYAGARWIEPRHDGQLFYNGYWEGDRGRFDHDHHWDRDRNRDYGHDRH